MANRRFDAPYCIGERRITIAGSFVPLTGAGTVVASTVKGFGFGYAPIAGVMTLVSSARPGVSGTPGVVRTSAGLYTITLDDSYEDVEHITASYWTPAAGLGTPLIVNPTTTTSFGVAATASSFQVVLTTTTGTPTDSGASCRISFLVTLRDSTVQFAKP